MVESKGFRDGKKKTLNDMEESGLITKEEHKRILEQREFDSVQKDSMSYKVLLQNDTIRKDIWKYQEHISKLIEQAISSQAKAQRYKVDLASGQLPELKPGIPMITEEVKHEIFWAENLVTAQIKEIVPTLSELRRVIGFQDLVGNMIMSEKEYDEYVKKIEASVRDLGHKLFNY